MNEISFTGYWDVNQAPPPISTEEAAFEEAARTGTPMPIVIDTGNGMEYRALVRVTKDGDGQFGCQPVAPLKRTMQTPTRGAERLPR